MSALPSTYSLLKINANQTKIGVITQSKYLAIGGLVHVFRPKLGLVVTQGWPNHSIAESLLDHLAQHPHSLDFDQSLLTDADASYRQFGILTCKGQGLAYTGHNLHAIKGDLIGDGTVAVGNFLSSRTVLPVIMQTAQREATGSLTDNLYASLMAGLKEGGEVRGQQSAAIKVWDISAATSLPELDLRVDDSPVALEELGSLIEKHHLYFDKPNRETAVAYAKDAFLLKRARQANPGIQLNTLYDLFRLENLEGRWISPALFDQSAIAFLEQRYLN